jgi:hypothetical protein
VGVVLEGPADLCHEIREIGFGDECRRPEPLLQHRLGQDSRAIQRQRDQQLERLGREVNLFAAARQLSGVEIDRERTEANPQDGPLGRNL